MQVLLQQWLRTSDVPQPELVGIAAMLGLILLISVILHFVLHRVVVRILANVKRSGQKVWHQALFERRLFTRLALTVQGIIIYIQAGLWLPSDSLIRDMLQLSAQVWVLVLALLTFYSVLDTLLLLLNRSAMARSLPLRGLFQSFKLAAAILFGILIVAALIGRSPVILFSGLGAMTAVLLLVFKDPILGLVAGIQLSANKMLAVGDWLEMPKYGADGDVIDISLTTVKVQNWDKTITTIPTYALISDSFKNWRGMSDAGGRRIKRSISIDVSSVHFLDEDELTRLRKAQLLSRYIEEKLVDIAAYNQANSVDPSSPVNGRRLTNLGTFRAYLTAYLKNHKQIHQNMTLMVRQLPPSSNGIPIEVYAFTNNIEWAVYEGIQADIFDHILAILPEFGLVAHQTPTGADVKQALATR